MVQQMNMIHLKTPWVPKMIVFDKDGTLGDCTESLRTWAKRMTEYIILECQRMNLSSDLIRKVIHQFHYDIGWNPSNQCLEASSLLSAGTWGQILDATALAIQKHTMIAFHDIRDKVKLWNDSMGDTHAHDEPLVDDLPGLLALLKYQNRGLMIAICTSDDRRSTNSCIKNWKIEKHIDFSICGDEVLDGKPSAEPLLELCRQAQIAPEDCLIVGDTSADTGMGRKAKAGLIVGVLTGTGTQGFLLNQGADIVIPNINYLLRIISYLGGNHQRTKYPGSVLIGEVANC